MPDTPLLTAYAQSLTPSLNAVMHMDCFDLMARLEPASVDAIITDMPYAYTEYGWDTAIDLNKWWVAVGRVLKREGCLITTAAQPFTSALVMSKREWFRYEWIWIKPYVTGMMNARAMPMKKHEHILVFSQMRANSNQFTDERAAYYPQGIRRVDRLQQGISKPSAINHQRVDLSKEYIQAYEGYPHTLLEFDGETGLHPTQKPVALYEYLIRTYTQPGEVVLDPFAGSATTFIAALNTGRNCIGGDMTREYVDLGNRRIANWRRDSDIEVAPGVMQMGLFANTA